MPFEKLSPVTTVNEVLATSAPHFTYQFILRDVVLQVYLSKDLWYVRVLHAVYL